MNRENPLARWLRQALIGAGLFLLGAILAFGYSYIPLHGALSWEVDQLESRLDERNRENLRLSDALAKQKSIDAARIAPETFAQVERELNQTKRVLGQAEKDLTRSERKRKKALASATKWQHRFEEVRDQRAALAAVTIETLDASKIEVPSQSPPASVPAATIEAAPSKPEPASVASESQPGGERAILTPTSSP